MKSIVGKLLSGRYLIVRQLKQQPFHTTFLAEDKHQKNDSLCSIKQYKLSSTKKAISLANSHQFNRFLCTEIQKNRQFSHCPQISATLDYFIQQQEFYLIRDFISGETLETQINNRQLEELEVTKLITELLYILDIIHSAGNKHLNIKPSNIIFNNKTKKYVLTDFGNIQQLLKKNIIIKSRILAVTHETNNYYHAPEQKAGKPENYSDFYAVGVIAIKALTGKYPHEVMLRDLDNYARASIVELETAKTTCISSHLAKIINNLLNTNSRSLYTSAKDILQALEKSQNVVLLPSPHKVLTDSYSTAELTTSSSQQSRKIKKLRISTIILVTIAFCSLLIWSFVLRQRLNNIKLSNDTERIFVEYYNQNYNFTIQYPPQWQLKELEDPITGEIAVLTAPLENESDLFSEKIYISVDLLSHTPEESRAIVADRISQNKNITNIVYLSRTNEVSDRPVKSIRYQREEENVTLQQKEFFVSQQDRVYLITLIAEKDKYQEYLSIVEKVLESFTNNSYSDLE